MKWLHIVVLGHHQSRVQKKVPWPRSDNSYGFDTEHGRVAWGTQCECGKLWWEK